MKNNQHKEETAKVRSDKWIAGYNHHCSILGMDAAINFVTFSPRFREVGFTAGKPNEIRFLAKAARKNGYKLSAALAKF